MLRRILTSIRVVLLGGEAEETRNREETAVMALSHPTESKHHHALVVVLGDAGRSPRMSYHALSLLQDGSDVTLVGYGGSPLLPQLTEYGRGSSKSRFTFRPIPRHPAYAVFNTFKPLKALFQLVSLFAVLFRCTAGSNKDNGSPVDVLLLQIPPAIPTMLVCIVVAFVRRVRLVFDWHNFGHSLMGYGVDGRRGAREGLLQRLARSYEMALGPMADGNLCVTNAMGRLLKEAYRGTEATTFYDRPRRDVFTGRTDVRAGVALLSRFVEDERRERSARSDSALVVRCLQLVMDRMRGRGMGREGDLKLGTSGEGAETTSLACRITSKSARSRSNRSGQRRNTAADPSTREALLMVSSTSWTPDEDFSILLDAMVRYDGRAAAHAALPYIVLFVTGKGPLKDHYLQKIDRLELSHVAIRTVWLEPEDYPRLLGCADLGVSLHASSSGVDLPMKVVDMFGAQTPVAALGYPCLAEEMVVEGKNGVVFSSSGGLCERLEELLADDWEGLGRMQRYVRGQSGRGCERSEGLERWEEAWQRVARGVILGDLTQGREI